MGIAQQGKRFYSLQSEENKKSYIFVGDSYTQFGDLRFVC